MNTANTSRYPGLPPDTDASLQAITKTPNVATCDYQHGACGCSMEQAISSCNCSMEYANATCDCSMEHAIATYDCNMRCSMRLQHAIAACVCSTVQHANAACGCNVRMQHASAAFSMRLHMIATISVMDRQCYQFHSSRTAQELVGTNCRRRSTYTVP